MTRLLISSDPFLTKAARVNDGRLSIFTMRRKSDSIIVGNIYKGVVKNISQSLNAAFVDIGMDKNAFLSMEKLYGKTDDRDIKPGDVILVQVFKPNISTKGPKVTTNITLPGNYLVLLKDNSFIGVSKQIQDSEKAAKLKDFLRKFATGDTGFIARTTSQFASFDDLKKEIEYLKKTSADISRKAALAGVPSLIYEEPPLPMWIVREYCDENTKEIIIDNEDVYNNTLQYLLKTNSPYLKKLKLYSFSEPIFKHFRIEEPVKSLESNTVNLKNGEYIIIEKTEALFSIDVNSGKYNYGNEAENAIFEINKEAAYEIFNQITLRDMGGLIVVDFIDMESEKHKRELEAILQKLAYDNKRETHVSKISEFGLVEISRRKNDNDIFDKMFDKCEGCLNSGLVKSISLICSEIYEKIRYSSRKLKLTATANVVGHMFEKIGYFDNRITYETKSGCNAEDYILEEME